MALMAPGSPQEEATKETWEGASAAAGGGASKDLSACRDSGARPRPCVKPSRTSRELLALTSAFVGIPYAIQHVLYSCACVRQQAWKRNDGLGVACVGLSVSLLAAAKVRS